VTGGGTGFGRDFFVSYCREDRAWAEWIAWELENAGFRVLVQAWDAVPGTNWPALVADGAARGGRLVAVLSPPYLSSVMGTAQWQAVWAADPTGLDRLLVPVRVADCAARLLDTRTAIDLTGLAGTAGGAERARSLLLDGIEAALSGRAKPPGPVPFPERVMPFPPPSPWEGPVRLGGGPPARATTPAWREPLPEFFVARPGPLGQVREMLVDPSSPRVVGLVGMGGAGKSTLARAVAAEPPVQAEFADGIVWIDVGPSPDLPACLTRVLAALGDADPVFEVSTGTDRLRRLLDGARCLLVLDDVCDADHLRAFDLGRTVRLLVTTRSRDALFTTTHAVCELGPVDEPTARQVLARYARCGAESLPEAAETVIRRCGGLVLALAIAGGMVAEGRRWAGVAGRLAQADLGKLAGRFPDYPHPDLLAALEASVGTLPAEQRNRYVELAVFAGRGPVPVEVVVGLWQATGGMDFLDGEELLLSFGRRCLATLDPRACTFTLHDLLFDYTLASADPDRLAALHGTLADLALTRWGGVDARLPGLRTRPLDAPADRYALENTVAHLLAAGRDDGVHALLAVDWPTTPGRQDNAWFTAHERTGLTAGYLADVRAAWRCAERAADAARECGLPPVTIGLELLYALITGSIASIAGSVPPSLLLRLVESDVWPVAKAVAYADAIPDPPSRVKALASLAPHLPEPERTRVLRRAFDAATPVYDPTGRALTMALARLVPNLPADLVGRVFDLAAAIDHPYFRARALGDLAPHLSEPERTHVLSCAIEAVPAIENPADRVEISSYLMRYLPEPERTEILRRAQDAAAAVDNPAGRAHVLGELAPRLSEPERVKALRRAFDTAAGIDDPYLRSWALGGLAPRLSEPMRTHALGRALDAATAVGDPSDLAEVLGGLVAHLPADLLGHVLDTATTIDSPPDRAELLGDLVPRLSEPERTRALKLALDAAAAIDHPYIRSRALGHLAQYLAEPHRARVLGLALDAAVAVDDPPEKAEALGDLAPYLPVNLLGRALGAAAVIGDSPPDRAQLLGELTRARNLPEPERTRALGRALDIAAVASPYFRVCAPGDLAPHQPEPARTRVLDFAIRAAATIDNPHDRADALGGLAQHLAEPERKKVLGLALDAAAVIDNTSGRAGMLGALAPHLPADLLGRALGAAGAIDNPPDRTRALGGLAPHLPEPDRTQVLGRALDATACIDDPYFRARVLGGLAPHLPADLLSRGIDDAAAIDNSPGQALALGSLAPHLPADLLGRAIDTATAIEDQYFRTRALCRLAPHLPAVLVVYALDAAVGTIDNPSSRVDVLVALALHSPEPERTQVLSRALDAASAIDGHSDRARSMVEIAQLQGQGADGTDMFWRAAVGSAARVGRPAVLAAVPRPLLRVFPDVGHSTVEAVARVFSWWP
jgi:hypothetical protein